MQTMTLEELLQKRYKAEQPSSDIVDWDGRKIAWLERLNGLFGDIKTWMGPLTEKRFVELSERYQIEITEQYIGSYKAPLLDIISGRDIVRLTPVGTLLIGGFGRVDMKGPKGREYMIVLSDSDRPSGFYVQVSDGLGKVPPQEETLSSAQRIRDRCQWYFIHSSDRQRKKLVTQTTFEEILMEMLMP